MVIAAVVMSIVALCLAVANMLIGSDHVERFRQRSDAAHSRVMNLQRDLRAVEAQFSQQVARLDKTFETVSSGLRTRIGRIEDSTTDCEVLRQRLSLIEAGMIAILESPTKASRDFLKQSKPFTKQQKAAQRDAARG